MDAWQCFGSYPADRRMPILYNRNRAPRANLPANQRRSRARFFSSAVYRSGTGIHVLQHCLLVAVCGDLLSLVHSLGNLDRIAIRFLCEI